MARNDMEEKFKSMSVSSVTWEDYLCLNMIKDQRTEKYVKAAKVIVLFQGALCLNRQNITCNLAELFKNSVRVLSDVTYCKENFCSYNPERTEEFHMYFKKECKRACEEGSNLIVIDASLTHLQQLEFYLFLAQKFQYVVLIVPPIVTVDVTSREQFKNVKQSQAQCLLDSGVKFSAIGGANTFEHFFCAWFLHEADSESLRCEAGLYMQDCFENIDRFAARYSQVCTVEDFRTYFNLEDRRQDLAYCVVTVFDCLRKQSDFFSKKCVNDLYGKMSKLTIIGFIISRDIIAARVKLSYKQAELYDMPYDWDENSEVKPMFFPSKMMQESKISLPEDVKLVACKANPTLVKLGDPFYEPLKQVKLNARARSCHIVLGKAPNARRINIDYDVHFAIHRERRLRATHPMAIEEMDLGRSIVFGIGRFWYIYLKQHLVIDGFLATCSKPKMLKDC